MRENVKTALIAIIGTGSLLIVIVMAVCLYMAFSLSRSFQVAQIQKVTEEVTSSVAQLSSDAEQLLAFVGNDVVASYDTFDEAADALFLIIKNTPILPPPLFPPVEHEETVISDM